MRKRHFEALKPICPRCRAAEREALPLILAHIERATEDEVEEGILHCPNPACVQEYPIIDGVPIIVPDVASFIASQIVQITVGDGFGAAVESLVGDATGGGSAYDSTRQHISTYAWDGYGEADPEEGEGGPRPGAVGRGLVALLELAGAAPVGPRLDLGCSVGASTLGLAARCEDLVLGIDFNMSKLRFARRVLRTGRVSYARRRIGVVYDRRDFPIAIEGGERVDFWCCDAQVLPFKDESFALATALNLLDCLPSPLDFLQGLVKVLAPGGKMAFGTPYDWINKVTQPTSWIGGHSQRGPLRGAAEPLLRMLLTPGAHPQSIAGIRLLGEIQDWPWHTRLHERSTVSYRAHLVSVERTEQTG